MRVEVKTEETTAQGIEVGEVFYKNGDYFIRTEEFDDSNTIIVVNIDNGRLLAMSRFEEVRRVHGKFTIDW